MGMAVSFKKATNKTNINHNNREMTEKQRERNPHIDYERSDDNRYLVQENLRDLYKREFGEAQEAYNAKQTRNDRKIDDYYKHIENSKKTAVQQEMIIQVGDKDDFSSRDQFASANQILEEWFQEFQERNPNLKVYNAAIHNDEASPHMHLNFVPVAEGYKRGLERQVSFDRAIKQQDSTLDKTRPFEDWREKEVGALADKLQERGIERKLVGTNEYQDVTEYKEKQDELKALNQQIEAKQESLKTIRSVMPDEETEIAYLKPEKNWLQKETGNVVLSGEQYEELKEQIKSAGVLKKDYERMQTGELKQNNRDLQQSAQQAVSLAKQYENETKELKQENKQLKQENTSLKAQLSHIKRDMVLLYKTSREFLKERTDSLKAFQNDFKDFVNQVRNKTKAYQEKHDLEPKQNEFEKVHKKEVSKEKNRGMEL